MNGKVADGKFGFEAVGYSASVEKYIPEVSDSKLVNLVDLYQKLLGAITMQNYKNDVDAARAERLKALMKNLRFYKTEFGPYPSVSSVNDPEYKAHCTPEELETAIAEGNISHARAAHYGETGVWLPVENLKEIPTIAQDLVRCKNRFLDGWDFPAMQKEYGLKDFKNGSVVVNHKHRYAGTDDGECLAPLELRKGAPLVPTLIDFKRSFDKEKNLTQIAAYASCPERKHIKQMMVIKTNCMTAKGFCKPIISTEINHYLQMFLVKRAFFLETYGF